MSSEANFQSKGRRAQVNLQSGSSLSELSAKDSLSGDPDIYSALQYYLHESTTLENLLKSHLSEHKGNEGKSTRSPEFGRRSAK